jgi:hypothetical protein
MNITLMLVLLLDMKKNFPCWLKSCGFTILCEQKSHVSILFLGMPFAVHTSRSCWLVVVLCFTVCYKDLILSLATFLPLKHVIVDVTPRHNTEVTAYTVAPSWHTLTTYKYIVNCPQVRHEDSLFPYLSPVLSWRSPGDTVRRSYLLVLSLMLFCLKVRVDHMYLY